jgi:hypothetical protein
VIVGVSVAEATSVSVEVGLTE